MTDDMYLRIKHVTTITGLSRATIYNMMAVGQFPMKTALGVRAVGWLSSEIQNWMAERKLIEKRGAEAKPAQRKTANVLSPSQPIPELGDRPVDAPEIALETQAEEPDWGDNDPAPTVAERNAVSERLRLINALKRRKGVPVKTVSRATPVFREPSNFGSTDTNVDVHKSALVRGVIKGKR